MTFFLKILNECRSRSLLRVNGSSGILYSFKWDAKLRAYTYQPKKQEEVDDLFKTMRRSTAYVFVPVAILPKPDLGAGVVGVLDDEPETVTSNSGVNLVARVAEIKPPLPAPLVEMALHRGVIVTEDDTPEVCERLVAAYDKGAADSLNSLPHMKRTKRKPA